MDVLCNSLKHLLFKVSNMLQDILRDNQNSVENDQIQITLSSPSQSLFSQNMVEIIAVLTDLSLLSSKVKREMEQKSQKTVDCLTAMKDLIAKQREEIRILSRKTVCIDTQVSTDDFQVSNSNFICE
jgi:hypothetical protein